MPVVDTSIYNSKGIDPGQIADGYAEGVRLKDMQSQMASRAIQQQTQGIELTKLQRGQQAELLQRGVVKFDPTTGQPSMDPDAFNKYAAFDPNGAMAMKQQQQQQQLAAQKGQIELHHMQLGDMSDILRGAHDEPSYKAAVDAATAKTYLHPGELPSTYAEAMAKSPGAQYSPLEAHLNQALSLQDVLKEKHENIGDANKTMEATAKKVDSDVNVQKLPFEKAKADAESLRAKTGQSELGIKQQDLDLKRKELYGETPPVGPNGQVNDPSILVPHAVPKAQQQKVYEEIKNAQDINSLSPKIMAAFDKGSSRNPITAAQGQREFEGLINTTVKEQEGTARQAAFDSIHEKMTPGGTFAVPGDNDSKRRTVLEYLASKAAAPVAKSHGIDLSQYPTTALDAKTLNGQQAAPAIKAPVPGTIEDGHVYVGGDPASPKSWVKR